MQVTILGDLHFVQPTGKVILVIIKMPEVSFNSDLTFEMANSWCIELDPSLKVIGWVVWSNDHVGAEVLRKRGVVRLSVGGVGRRGIVSRFRIRVALPSAVGRPGGASGWKLSF